MPKPDSDQRRFILDLSKPAGFSVNDGISKDFYLGQPVTLRYPTVDNIAERIVQFGSGCLLYKRDLKPIWGTSAFNTDEKDHIKTPVGVWSC